MPSSICKTLLFAASVTATGLLGLGEPTLAQESFSGAERSAPTRAAHAARGPTCRPSASSVSAPRTVRSSPSGIDARTDAALGGGACCVAGGACEATPDVAACNSLGGFFFEGLSCADDPCGTGACCSEGSCSLSDAYGCLSGGRDFAGAGTDCLSDPCGDGVGACCSDGGCAETGLDACNLVEGSWLGAGTLCSDGPCETGSCCQPGVCEAIPQFECELAGGLFDVGGRCEPGACDVQNDCATDSLYAQTRDLPSGFTAYTSELAAGFERWENYSGAAGSIETVTWWGLDLELTPNGFIECTDPSGEFDVTLHADLAGRPGDAVCSFRGVVEQTATGIDYAGAELNEYRVDLPEACVLTQGWLSIVGGGDPDCWFLWMSSPIGDERSLCDNCEERNQPDDLALCLGGPSGGITGACCDGSTGTCTDGVDISECVGIGQTFSENALCGELDPPCAPTPGACCDGIGGCTGELPADCVASGGTWLGAGAPCSFCPIVGACCSNDESCTILTESDCGDIGASWIGPGSVCEDCPEVPECRGSSLFPQSPDGPDDFIAGTSEVGTAFSRSENFQEVAGPTRAVRWWGVDLDNIEGTDNFIECVESDPTFDLIFSEDAGGVPGETLCEATVLAQRDPLGLLYLGAELNEYRALLPEACPVVDGWLSIVGRGDPECWFLWMSAGVVGGESHCEGCIPEAQDFDLALCMAGPQGGVAGACCDDATAQCSDGVDISQCTSPSLRFSAETACSELDPACGTVLGACCRGDATCDPTTFDDCLTQGGQWQGADTLCDSCPCTIVCPGGAEIEGERTCSDGYIDNFNGGCGSNPPVFSTLDLGDNVCGTSGLFLDGLEVTADEDWYQVEVDEAGLLIWSATAEFVSTVSVLDATAGCPGTLLASASADECGTATISLSVEPGTYWLVVEPSIFTDAASCPASYTARVELQ